MPGKPPEPPAARRPVDQSSAGNRARAAPHEHSGPVVIARHLKDDGRSLILYSREPERE
jgi:hypothetical protein